MRSRLLTLSAALAASLCMASCTRAAENDAFGQKVRAYLLAHPEVIEEAVEKLQSKRAAEAAADLDKSVRMGESALAKDPALRKALEQDPRDFVANPAGKVTMTEFYDYRCPHCINIAPQVLSLIHSDPDVRVVFKEMPIFGDTSEHAARAAIAVRKAGGDYLGFYKTLMTTHGLNDQIIDTLLKARGIDPAKAEDGTERKEADAQIAAVHSLAEKLFLTGTPGFIIGDVIVPGEDMPAIKAAIAKAKASKRRARASLWQHPLHPPSPFGLRRVPLPQWGRIWGR